MQGACQSGFDSGSDDAGCLYTGTYDNYMHFRRGESVITVTRPSTHYDYTHSITRSVIAT